MNLEAIIESEVRKRKISYINDFPGVSDGKASAYNVGDPGSIPGSGRSGEGNGNPPVFLPGKSHGQRSLVGCSPWGCQESDPTERLHFYFLFDACVWNLERWY